MSEPEPESVAPLPWDLRSPGRWSHVPKRELQGQYPSPRGRPCDLCGLQRQGCSSAPKGGQHDLEGHTHSVSPAWPAPLHGGQGSKGTPTPSLHECTFAKRPLPQHTFQVTRSSLEAPPPTSGSAGPQAPSSAARSLSAAAQAAALSQARPGLCSFRLPSSASFFPHLSPAPTSQAGLSQHCRNGQSGSRTFSASVSMCPKLGPKQMLPACTVQSPLDCS